MTDTTLIDMAPFFARHDRNTRRTYLAMLSISLGLSVVIWLPALLWTDRAGSVLRYLSLPIVVSPFSIVALWIASWMYGRTRPPARPDGTFPMNPDDARNTERVANAGAVFVTGYGVVMIAIQLFWALRIFGILPLTAMDTKWGFRLVMAAVGTLMIYFGNVSPRMPTPRAPEAKPAVRMKYNRVGGWVTVVFGALLALAALLLPDAKLLDAVGGLSMALCLVLAVFWFVYRNALKRTSA